MQQWLNDLLRKREDLQQKRRFKINKEDHGEKYHEEVTPLLGIKICFLGFVIHLEILDIKL